MNNFKLTLHMQRIKKHIASYGQIDVDCSVHGSLDRQKMLDLC